MIARIGAIRKNRTAQAEIQRTASQIRSSAVRWCAERMVRDLLD
jgi:hypothetical protein